MPLSSAASSASTRISMRVWAELRAASQTPRRSQWEEAAHRQEGAGGGLTRLRNGEDETAQPKGTGGGAKRGGLTLPGTLPTEPDVYKHINCTQNHKVRFMLFQLHFSKHVRVKIDIGHHMSE